GRPTSRGPGSPARGGRTGGRGSVRSAAGRRRGVLNRGASATWVWLDALASVPLPPFLGGPSGCPALLEPMHPLPPASPAVTGQQRDPRSPKEWLRSLKCGSSQKNQLESPFSE
uniref:Uncharacterized protein n=1 Tax=Gallus gallus TaxID=9031 RepID=A0A8V0Z1R3_CHICK